MTVIENEDRISHIEKILDLLYPGWMDEEVGLIGRTLDEDGNLVDGEVPE